MKNLKYYLIIAALAIGLICLGIGWYKEHQTTVAFRKKEAKVKEQILTGAKEVARTIKENGTEALLLDITDNHTSIKNVNDTDMPDIVDTAALALDIRTKQLKEVTVIAAQYKAQNIQLVTQLDSLKQKFYTYNGNGLDLKFTPPYTPNGLATADFTGRFGITVAKGTKSKFLSKDKELLSVTSDSKYFTVDHVNYIGFDKDPFPFHAEIQPVASYNQFTGLSSGPGVKVQLGRLNISANYQYYDKFKQFGWGGTATYKIIGF
jgi:hypothetical protein